MIRQDHVEPREILVAEAIRNVVSELRMVDLADYVAFLRMGRIGNISDIVDSAAELYFMPGTLRFGHGGEAHVCWSTPPRIVLDLELRPRGATVYFTLALGEKDASVEVNYVAFDEPAGDPFENTDFLRTAIQEAALLPSPVG
jgi:hypothetical protein